MIGKDGLLSILQFIALIIPAFAIFMQMLSSQDGNKTINIFSKEINEYDIFQYSLVFVISGGALILYALTDYIASPVIGAGILLIFGSLPLTVVGIWFMNLNDTQQVGDAADEESNSIDERAISILAFYTPVVAIVGGYAILPRGILNRYVSHGVFANDWILTPSQCYIIAMGIVGIRCLQILSDKHSNADYEAKKVANDSFLIGTTLPLVYIVMVGLGVAPIELLSIGLAEFYNISKGNVFYNISYIWSILMTWAIVLADFTVLEDD